MARSTSEPEQTVDILRKLAEDRRTLLNSLSHAEADATRLVATIKDKTAANPDDLLVGHLAALGVNRAKSQEAWARLLKDLDYKDRIFVNTVNELNKQASNVPNPPRLAVGSVFAPYRVKEGIRPIYFVILSAVFVAVSVGSSTPSGGTDWPQFWLGVGVGVMTLFGVVLQAIQTYGSRRDRRDKVAPLSTDDRPELP